MIQFIIHLCIQIFHFQTEDEWKIVFYISAGIYLIGCVIYWFWASGEVQPWAIQTPNPPSRAQNNVISDIEKNGKIHAYANDAIEMKDEQN